MTKNFYLEDNDFSKEVNQDIVYGFFTRQGGVSKSTYNSLNCSFKNGDKRENVIENRKIVCEKFDLDISRLMILNQIHSSKIVEIDEAHLGKIFYADGMITSKRNILLGILTADCAPILFCGQQNIAILHVGWQGLIQGIIDNLINLFLQKNENLNYISCIIGPHLSYKSFRVEKDFVDKINKTRPLFLNYIKKNKGIFYFNFLECLFRNIHDNGIKKVFSKDIDTYTNSNILFSYRYYKNKGLECGRQISVIGKR